MPVFPGRRRWSVTDPGAPTLQAHQPGCTTPLGVQPISFSKTKYPTIRRHFRAALRRGWPRTLVLNRRGADDRRERGRNPRGWKADVRYVPSSENRSHGSVLGIKLRRFCAGTRFRYVFYYSLARTRAASGGTQRLSPISQPSTRNTATAAPSKQ